MESNSNICECWEERKALEASEAVEWQEWCDSCPLMQQARERVQEVYREELIRVQLREKFRAIQQEVRDESV